MLQMEKKYYVQYRLSATDLNATILWDSCTVLQECFPPVRIVVLCFTDQHRHVCKRPRINLLRRREKLVRLIPLAAPVNETCLRGTGELVTGTLSNGDDVRRGITGLDDADPELRLVDHRSGRVIFMRRRLPDIKMLQRRNQRGRTGLL